MVLSDINSSVTYPELKTLSENDKDFVATMYVVELYDTNCLIALGKLNREFEAKNIYYVPIYLVSNQEVISKIGVFEFEKDFEATIYDAERDFDLAKFEEPLLFDFVTKEFIKSKTSGINIPEMEDEGYVDEEEEVDEEKGSPVVGTKLNIKFPFPDDTEDLAEVQTPGEAKIEKDEFSSENANNWMETYMKNNNYAVEDVPDNGDCFFSVLKEAFVGIPLEVTVKELRQILVDHFDEETFTVRKERHDMFSKAIKTAELAVKEAKKTNAKKKKELGDLFKQKKQESQNKSISQAEKTKLVKEAKKARSDWNALKPKLQAEQKKKEELLKIAKEDYKPYRIMGDVTKIEQFTDKMKTTEYWADEWAISKLEGLLKVYRLNHIVF